MSSPITQVVSYQPVNSHAGWHSNASSDCTIGVFLAGDATLPKRLLDALSFMFHVQFVVSESEGTAGYKAALLLGFSREAAIEVSRRGLRCLAFLGNPVKPTPRNGADIQLSLTPYLAECLRGKSVPDKSIDRIVPLMPEAEDEILARRGDDVLWLCRREGAGAVDLVATHLFDLVENDYLYAHLQKDDWARLFPLMHFLREVSGWQPPPIRACFMFDDPNLHWRSYGYIRYQELIEHAREHNYHTAIATIPMDCWYANAKTAALFRENADCLSLLFHGNNHTYYELTRTASEPAREALAAQATRRMERLERVTGIAVARVMAAPHGACNVEMSNVLLRSGFETACISRSSLMIRNPNVAWSTSVGMNPAEFLGKGLPVIPRFNIRWDTTYALFAAFLGQPIILVGHHDDLADGLDLLAHWARFINSMGKTQWTDTRSMIRANYCTRCRNGRLEIEMYSRRIILTVPAECGEVRVMRPWLAGTDRETLRIRRSLTGTLEVRDGESFVVSPGEQLVLSSVSPDMIDLSKVSTSLPGPWAVARRQLCELRDRARPVVDKFARGKHKRLTKTPFGQHL